MPIWSRGAQTQTVRVLQKLSMLEGRQNPQKCSGERASSPDPSPKHPCKQLPALGDLILGTVLLSFLLLSSTSGIAPKVH